MICISHMTALDAEPELMLEAAAKAGFDGVGLRIFPPKHAPDQYPIVGDPARTSALRRRADDLGIQIFEAESFGIDADFEIDSYLKALETAAELGASVVVSAGIDSDANRIAANYRLLAEAAAQHNILMAMEFMPYRGMRTLDDALAVHAKVAHPNAKLLIDAVHLSRTGASVGAVRGLDPSIIGHVHICDAPAKVPSTDAEKQAESRTGRLYPGEGDLPLKELLALLPQEVSFSVEAPHRDQQHLPPAERIRLAGVQTLAFMASIRSQAATE